jgi:hypothetical protein
MQNISLLLLKKQSQEKRNNLHRIKLYVKKAILIGGFFYLNHLT